MRVSCGSRAHAQLPAMDFKPTPSTTRANRLPRAPRFHRATRTAFNAVTAPFPAVRASACMRGLWPGAARERGPPPQRPPAPGCGSESSQVRVVAGIAVALVGGGRCSRCCACAPTDIGIAASGVTRSSARGGGGTAISASLIQLADHALRARMAVGSIPGGVSCAPAAQPSPRSRFTSA